MQEIKIRMSLALLGNTGAVGYGDCHCGNFLALVAMQARLDPVLRDLSFTANPGSSSEVSEREYRKQKQPFITTVSQRPN